MQNFFDNSVGIPVVDVAPFFDGDAFQQRIVADQLAIACEKVGFFCIVGHQVDEKLIARTRQAGVDFFASDKQNKYSVLRNSDRTGCGYYPLADRSLAKTLGVDTPPDLQEAWVMTPENVPDEPYYKGELGRYFFSKNKWPVEPIGFRETAIQYFEEMSLLGAKMMEALALALDIKKDYFADKVDKATNQFRIIHYPAQDSLPRENQLRAGAHTDYGALTLLRSDDVPGTLQVKIPGGDWTDVRPPSKAFVCNIGDALSRWTGGKWASTLHRVGNPGIEQAPEEVLRKGRISLVFFHQPNYDVVLTGIGKINDVNSPITMGEHHIQKIHAAVDSTPAAD